MKFFFDNNLSPYLAAGIRELSKGSRGIASEIIHLKEKFPPATPDHEWIQPLGREGGWAVISQDGLRKNDLEREALRKSGLMVFVLSKQWSDHKYWDKAQNLVRWWPSIEDYVIRIQGGAAVRVPWRMNGKFEQIRL
ncbi:hypothetical protein [Bordetella tumulicola]|uniref:PIN-like domain-containing protein n=1 Tax=Bordetella tumulicola TaxID=1649133 RepID=UPI0039F0122D